MTDIVFASHNAGKVREVSHLLRTDDIHLLTLGDVGLHDFMVDETGQTYEENAWLKAKTVGDNVHKLTLSDDSGLEVEALSWKPGIFSARYAKGSDADRCKKLLKELEGKQNRTARFVAVFIYYDPTSGEKKIFRGEVRGSIAKEVSGQGGFGYDPIFIPDGYSETMAELTSEIKNTISHRAVAVRAFKAWWESRKSASL